MSTEVHGVRRLFGVVSTDDIIPARYKHMHTDPDLLAPHTFEAFAPGFVDTVRSGDVLLLCSDGLTGPLTDEQVMQIMLRFEDPVRACRALTEAACAAGGPDNVTVAIVRFGGDDLDLPQGREPIALHRANHVVQS